MEKKTSDSNITMSSSICGGLTLLGALMVVGGINQHVMAGGIALIAISGLIYALINDEF